MLGPPWQVDNPNRFINGEGMHVIIWEFVVSETTMNRLGAAYGAEGDWAELFRRSDGYLGTELLRSSYDSHLFLTIDRWQSPPAFKEFCEEFAEVYQILDKSLEGLSSSEKKVGVFSVM